MIELVLAAALVWPAECVAFGELYFDAATIRDQGKPLKQVLKVVESKKLRLAIIQTYDRKDMTPRDWYWLGIGTCVGMKDPGVAKTNG